MKILISAYACEPGKGSEPGVGWMWVELLSTFAEVTVLTRANNRGTIEAAAEKEEWVRRVSWLYHDLPPSVQWIKRKLGLVQVYYIAWQFSALPLVRRTVQSHKIEVLHHLTFGSYWMPTLAGWVDLPVIFGPVGGAESAPLAFARSRPMSLLFEFNRSIARMIAEKEPSVRRCAKRSIVSIAKAPETASRLEKLGARQVILHSEVVLSDTDHELCRNTTSRSDHLELISVGRLHHLKGYQLALGAIAACQDRIQPFRYTIFGDGPHRRYLERVVRRLGLQDSVVFAGPRPRADVLRGLSGADIFIHPSLHDSGGWACVEAMAAALPVVCLRIGGPAVQIDDEMGIRVDATTPHETIDRLAHALLFLSANKAVRVQMGITGRARVSALYTRSAQLAWAHELYSSVLANKDSTCES